MGCRQFHSVGNPRNTLVARKSPTRDTKTAPDLRRIAAIDDDGVVGCGSTFPEPIGPILVGGGPAIHEEAGAKERDLAG
jgi:hypothetical protein